MEKNSRSIDFRSIFVYNIKMHFDRSFTHFINNEVAEWLISSKYKSRFFFLHIKALICLLHFVLLYFEEISRKWSIEMHYNIVHKNWSKVDRLYIFVYFTKNEADRERSKIFSSFKRQVILRGRDFLIYKSIKYKVCWEKKSLSVKIIFQVVEHEKNIKNKKNWMFWSFFCNFQKNSLF